MCPTWGLPLPSLVVSPTKFLTLLVHLETY